jgi:hypothetical protein
MVAYEIHGESRVGTGAICLANYPLRSCSFSYCAKPIFPGSDLFDLGVSRDGDTQSTRHAGDVAILTLELFA